MLLNGVAGSYLSWNDQADYTTTTLVGGENSTLFLPRAVAWFAEQLFIADTGNHMVRRFSLANGSLSTLAGSVEGWADGLGGKARLREPSGIAVDDIVGTVYVADTGNMVIRAIDPSTGWVRTVAGTVGLPGFVDGWGLAASFWRPSGLAIAATRRQLYVCDPYNHAVRVVHIDSAQVRTIAGSGLQGFVDGPGPSAQFHLPRAATVDEAAGYLYVVDGSPLVRQVLLATEPAVPSTGGSPYSEEVSTVYNGTAGGRLSVVSGVAYALDWDALILSDEGQDRVFRLALMRQQPPSLPLPPSIGETVGATSAAAPASSPSTDAGDGNPSPPATIGESDGTVGNSTGTGSCDSSSSGGGCRGMRRSLEGTSLTISVCGHGKPAPAGVECDGQLRLLGGERSAGCNGKGSATRFYRPRGIAIDQANQSVYVADSYNHQIRWIALTDIQENQISRSDSFVETTGKVFTHNLMLILIIVMSISLGCCCTYLVCRTCFLCPLYQRKLHKQRITTMRWGERV